MKETKSAHLLEVGYELEPLEFTVTSELNQQYLYAQEDFHPMYINEDESGPAFVHPSLLLNMSNKTRSPSFYMAPGWGAIHAGDDTEFINPAMVGKNLRVTWKVLEVYEKRGRPYNVIEAVMVDEDGREILRRKHYGTYTSSKTSK